MTADDAPPAWYTAMVAERAEGLVVGAKVRVRLSGECKWPHWKYEPNGSIGNIVDDRLVRTPGNDNGRHPFGINFDPGEGTIYYAAAELELLARAGVPAEQNEEG